MIAKEAESKLEKFKARAKAEQERRQTVTDSEFWCALVFETREQKAEFLSSLGLEDEGDKYLDGLSVAERLGVSLKSPRFIFRR